MTTDPDGNEVVLTISDGSIERFERTPPPAGSDEDFNDGFYVIEIDRVTPGSSVTAIIDFPEGVDIREYLGCSDDECDEIPGVEIDGNTVTVTLTDGGVGDGDGIANGLIVLQGGPNVRRGGGGGAIDPQTLILLAGLALLWRRRPQRVLEMRQVKRLSASR